MKKYKKTFEKNEIKILQKITKNTTRETKYIKKITYILEKKVKYLII